MEKLQPDDKIYFIRRCSNNTALMSPVETGTYLEDMPGWTLDPHIRVLPDTPDSKSISVPVSRVWPMTPEGRLSVQKYVENIKVRQEQALKRLQEKLEASKWKLKQICDIIENIP